MLMPRGGLGLFLYKSLRECADGKGKLFMPGIIDKIHVWIPFVWFPGFQVFIHRNHGLLNVWWKTHWCYSVSNCAECKFYAFDTSIIKPWTTVYLQRHWVMAQCWRYRWAATWQSQQNECAPSEDSDQSRLIRVFAVRFTGSLGPSFLHADSEDSDQTGRMPTLIWVFAMRTLTWLVLSCRGADALCNLKYRSTTVFFKVFENALLSLAYRDIPSLLDSLFFLTSFRYFYYHNCID